MIYKVLKIENLNSIFLLFENKKVIIELCPVVIRTCPDFADFNL